MALAPQAWAALEFIRKVSVGWVGVGLTGEKEEQGQKVKAPFQPFLQQWKEGPF